MTRTRVWRRKLGRTVEIASLKSGAAVHAELEIKFKKQLDWPKVNDGIRDIIAANVVPTSDALKGTPLAHIPSVVDSALAAERILNAATIVYFREGMTPYGFT